MTSSLHSTSADTSVRWRQLFESAPASTSIGRRSKKPWRTAMASSEWHWPPGPCHSLRALQLCCINARTTCMRTLCRLHNQLYICGQSQFNIIHLFNRELFARRSNIYKILKNKFARYACRVRSWVSVILLT